MAKIKLYIAKAQSNNSGAAKGTAENPYTEAEYEEAKNQEMVFKNGSAEDIFVCPACGVETREFDLKTEVHPYTDEEIGKIMTGFCISLSKAIKEIPGFVDYSFDRDSIFNGIIDGKADK